jgi:hypothetical protein
LLGWLDDSMLITCRLCSQLWEPVLFPWRKDFKGTGGSN